MASTLLIILMCIIICYSWFKEHVQELLFVTFFLYFNLELFYVGILV